MTRTGYICMIVIMLVSAGGMIVCGLKNRGTDSNSGHRPPRNVKGSELPTVTGEPVVFRTAEMRFVTCKSDIEISFERAAALGFDPQRPQDRSQARQYWEKELAYRLADQLLDAGGIRFKLDGSTYRAEIKAVLPEGSGT